MDERVVWWGMCLCGFKLLVFWVDRAGECHTAVSPLLLHRRVSTPGAR
jgi:hypothetical protein